MLFDKYVIIYYVVVKVENGVGILLNLMFFKLIKIVKENVLGVICDGCE